MECRSFLGHAIRPFRDHPIGTRYHYLTIHAKDAGSHAPSILPADLVEGVGDLAEGAGARGPERVVKFAGPSTYPLPDLVLIRLISCREANACLAPASPTERSAARAWERDG